MTDRWNAELYDDKHSFVWKLGSSVVELLAPQPGERIVDLGCGTGQLTAEIAETGAEVVGLDNSPAMIEQARRLYPQLEFLEVDAHDFDVAKPFDAVFSNAALHWSTEPARVIDCITRALKANGRLAVEFGGKGQIESRQSNVQPRSSASIGWQSVPRRGIPCPACPAGMRVSRARTHEPRIIPRPPLACPTGEGVSAVAALKLIHLPHERRQGSSEKEEDAGTRLACETRSPA